MTPAHFQFLADENIHPEVVLFLRSLGAAVSTVHELGLAGGADEEILHISHSTSRVVLTHDRDFGSLALAANRPVHGIIYLRPGHIQGRFTIEVLKAIFASPLELRPPFILVAHRTESRIRLRLRALSV